MLMAQKFMGNGRPLRPVNANRGGVRDEECY